MSRNQARWAERVMRDGNWFHPAANHGSTNAYDRYGCRCEPCRATVESRKNRAKDNERYARNLQEREIVNGYPVHPRANHGTLGAYQRYGCRCGPCRAAASAQYARKGAPRRAEERQRLQRNRIQKDGAWFHPEAPHGTFTGYTTYGCRCTKCRGYNSKKNIRVRERHNAQLITLPDGTRMHPNAPHGTATGRTYYGCQCQPCRTASRQLRDKTGNE